MGTHTAVDYVLENPGCDFLVLCPTYTDWKKNLLLGRDGFMNICPKEILFHKNPYDGEVRTLKFYNGSKIHGYSATDPDKLRGNNFSGMLWDEAAYANNASDLWDEVQRVVRVGRNRLFMITTTPNHLKFLRDISKDKRTIEIRGGSFENETMLEEDKEAWKEKYTDADGNYTKMGRQELFGDYVDFGQGGLWTMDNLNRFRIKPEDLPALSEIVIAIDPAPSSGSSSDESGIAIMGRAERTEHLYFLKDLSCREKGPRDVCEIAAQAYFEYGASLIAVEENGVGEAYKDLIEGIDDRIQYKKLWAKMNKKDRADPIAALSEKGKIHMVGEFPVLESQLMEYTGDIRERSPDRLDAFVWAADTLSKIETRICIV